MIITNINGCALKFETAPGLFSPRKVDRGTLAMLSVIDFAQGDRVLDLGCGYGVVGIVASKLLGEQSVVMVDKDQMAVTMAKSNALSNSVPNIEIVQSDGYANVRQHNFTKILSHPPYHVDFSVPKMFIEKGFNRLALNGRMVMVTKRREWYKNKLTSIFGGVRIWEVEDYFVFMAEKRRGSYSGSNKSSST